MDNLKTNILGVDIDVISKEEALDKLIDCLNSNSNHLLFTPNPEMVMRAKRDTSFLNILNSGDLVVADGIGVVMASKFNKIKIKERVTGCDLIFSLLDKVSKDGKTIYILGGKPEIVEKAALNSEKLFKGIKVVGYRDGYFKNEDEKNIVAEIKRLKPDIVLIGLGMEKQESFAYKYKNNMNTKITACIGGTIDVLSGEVRRAPKIFRKLGLEWFYRLISNPSRIGRMLQLPLFVLAFLADKLKKI